MDLMSAMATFVRAVDAGSLSAAARSLPSSLTSVSRQISALEQHFGTRLLLRTTRQLALTDEGRILYERAKAIIGEVREIEAALSRGRHQPSGRIRVSSPSLMGRLVIAPLLAEFLRRYPALSVDLLLVDRAVDMVEEDIHLAIRVGRLRDSQLVARKLADIRMIVCASPAYLAQRGTPETPGDLVHHDCLVFSDAPGSAEWRFAEDGKAGRKIRISGRLWMNSLEAPAAAAKGRRRHRAGAVVAGRDRPGRRPPGAAARRLRAGAGAIAPDVSAVAAGFAEDQGLRRLPHRALARRRSVQRAARESIKRIIVQFLNRARGLWYTKLLINRVS